MIAIMDLHLHFSAFIKIQLHVSGNLYLALLPKSLLENSTQVVRQPNPVTQGSLTQQKVGLIHHDSVTYPSNSTCPDSGELKQV